MTDIKFIRIAKIELLPPEQVFDIEVEGTHNFIGNDIVAHNTYITGGLGVGQVETTAGNITGTGRLAMTGASATSTLAGGLAIETSGLVYDWQTNNVGIGTAGPGRLLHLYNGSSSADLMIAGQGTNIIMSDLSGSTGSLDIYYNNDLFSIESPQFVINRITGNVGIGTTTPNWLLQAAGTRPFFTLSDTGASANLKHWFLSSQGGNFYIGTSSDALATSTVSKLTITSTGNVGVGTTTPYAQLSVAGLLAASSFNADSASATSTLASGLAIETSGLVYDWQTNNVGIGTAAPVAKFHVSSADTSSYSQIVATDGSGNGHGVGLWSGKSAATVNHPAIMWSNGEDLRFIGQMANFGTGSGGSEFMRITNSGNVGIGTTTPNWLLQAAGTRPFFTLSDTAAAANLKHWFLSSQGGNLYIGTSSDAYATSTISALTINSNGWVGIATTSPAVNFAVAGQCVTGDTELTLIESGQIKKVQIKDVKGGEYVLSLNEKTGKLEPARIKGLLDMGVKPIYKITTEDGKTIRTTANHPYLTKNGWQKVANLDEGGEIATTKDELEIFRMVEENQTEKNQQNYAHDKIENKIAHNNLFISAVNNKKIADNEDNANNNVSNKKTIHNFESGNNLSPSNKARTAKIIPAEKVSRLKSLPAIPGAKMETKVEPTSSLDKSNKYSEIFSNLDSVNFINNSNYSNGDNDVSSGSELTDIKFIRIAKIELLPPEQVFDIEVEGTHNFIGNGIVAHNTYITGGLGVGTREDTNGNITGTGRLAITGTTATSTLAGGLAIETSGLVYDWQTNRVGIGTAAPTQMLQLNNGNIYIGTGEFMGADIADRGSKYQKITLDITGNSLQFYTGSSSANERMRINSAGNVGIGTTTPNWLLQAAGTRPFFTLSDTGAAANQKHWFLSSQSGNLYVGTSSDAYATSTVSALTINSNGWVGIATTSPAVNFAVAGQCVTGDTRLRRRRKRKKISNSKFLISNQITNPNDQNSEIGHSDIGNSLGQLEQLGQLEIDDDYIYDEVQIKDINPGDEIASLDEKTGKIVWSRVNALMDMGVKEIYKLTTDDGRQIRTTGNHPYLVQAPDGRQAKHQSAVNGSAWLTADKIKSGDYIAAPKPRVGVFIDDANMFYAQKKAGWRVDYGKLSNYLRSVFDVKFMNYYLTIPSIKDSAYPKTSQHLSLAKERYGNLLTIKSKPLKYIFDKKLGKLIKKGNVDGMIAVDLLGSIDELDAVIILSGDSDYVDVIAPLLKKRKKVLFMGFKSNMAWELRQRQHVYFDKIRQLVESAENKNAPDFATEVATGVPLLLKLYSRQEILSSRDADNSEFIWSRVKSIEKSAPEQVYDIEVEGTHNFIGNDIVAHNTYITGGLGVGTREDTDGNITGTGRLAITSTSATSTFSTGGLTVGGSQFVVQQNSGNVGIGSSSPSALLSLLNTSTTNGMGIFASTTLQQATGNEVAYQLNYTTNKAAGNDTGLLINMTDTASPGTSYLLDLQVGGTTKFSVDELGQATFRTWKTTANTLIQAGSTLGRVNIVRPSSTEDLAFELAPGSAGVERMRIKSTGNVGIGTSTPNWNLQIASSTKTFLTLSDMSAGTDLKHWFLSSQGGNFYIGTSSDALATSTVSKLTITSAGNVGVGTTTPYGQLSVAGLIAGDNLNINSTSATSTFSTGGLTVGGSQFVVQQTSGNVGIGTTAPASELDVKGLVTITEKLGSEMVVNGGFDADTDWTKGSGWTIASGVATHGAGTGTLVPAVALTPTVGTTYKIQFTVSNWTVAGMTVSFGGVTAQANTAPVANGTQTLYVTAVTTGSLIFTPVTGARYDIDNVTIKPVTSGLANTAGSPFNFGSKTLSDAVGNEVAYTLNYTTNKATSGNDTGLLINMTDTASPGSSFLQDWQVGGISKVLINNTGQVVLAGGSELRAASGNTLLINSIAQSTANIVVLL